MILFRSRHRSIIFLHTHYSWEKFHNNNSTAKLNQIKLLLSSHKQLLRLF